MEGGRRAGADDIAPLLARFPIPAAWRCVVVVPRGAPGLSGDAEAAAFERLPPPPEREVERVAHLVLMQLLPALVEADLASFGAALTEIQRVTGAWFAPQQGGIFAPGPSETLVATHGRVGRGGGRARAPGGRRCMGWSGARTAGRETGGAGGGAAGIRRAGFRGGIRGFRGPGLAVRNCWHP